MNRIRPTVTLMLVASSNAAVKVYILNLYARLSQCTCMHIAFTYTAPARAHAKAIVSEGNFQFT